MWKTFIFCFLYWLGYDTVVPAIALVYLNTKVLREVIPWIWHYARRRSPPDFKQYGEWAVVTGATDGIGKGYAEELASLGLNIVLISRSLSKLENCAKEIESTFKVKTHVIVCDFSTGFKNYDHLRKSLEDFEIGLLVNNVGIANGVPEQFSDISIEFNEKILNTNVASMLQITHAILPQMLERGRGAIINISSICSILPTPQLAVYGSTKAFIRKFSSDLAREVGPKGIQVQAHLPGAVATKMTYRNTEQFLVRLKPRRYAKEALEKFAIAGEVLGRVDTFGNWEHAVSMVIMDFLKVVLPEKVYYNNVNRVMDQEKKRIIELVDEGKYSYEKFK